MRNINDEVENCERNPRKVLMMSHEEFMNRVRHPRPEIVRLWEMLQKELNAAKEQE